jgi:hypothetical protein
LLNQVAVPYEWTSCKIRYPKRSGDLAFPLTSLAELQQGAPNEEDFNCYENAW